MKRIEKKELTREKVKNFLKRGYHIFYKKDGKEYELIQTVDNRKLFYCYALNQSFELDSFEPILESFDEWNSVIVMNSYKIFLYE